MAGLRPCDKAHNPLAGAQLSRYPVGGFAARLDAQRVAPGVIENLRADGAVMEDHVGAGDAAHVAQRQ